MNINRKTFFSLTKGVVGGWTKEKVAGVDAILDALESEGVSDLRQMAYVLATPMIETGGSYQTITENLNYRSDVLVDKFKNRISQAEANKYGRTTGHKANQEAIANIIYGGDWGKKNLGNTLAGDGWKYRGRGFVQITGRRLYELFGYADNPDEVNDVKASALIIVRGMRDGSFTGKKLIHYFNSEDENWTGARRIVNGTDRAFDIANYARKFYEALKKAEVANPYPLKSSRTIQGAVAAGAAGSVNLVNEVNDIVKATEAHQEAFTSGSIVGITIALIAVLGAVYAFYARWDDAGRPSLFK